MPWGLIIVIVGIIFRFGLNDGSNGWDFNFHLVGDMFIALGAFYFLFALCFLLFMGIIAENARKGTLKYKR